MLTSFATAVKARRLLSAVVLSMFIVQASSPVAFGQNLEATRSFSMVGLSAPFAPVLIKGVELNAQDPLVFDFIIDKGAEILSDKALTDETTRLVKYFLAGIAIPQSDLWVNLSPVEKDRVIADGFSRTDMGRDMLAQDFLLKQMTSSLLYPETDLGRKFWDHVYSEAQKKFGTTDIPLDSINKVWITPQEATVYRHGNRVFVANAHLKVMLESDYVALKKTLAVETSSSASQELAKQVLREIVVPVLEREINEGKNFAQLRQIFHSLILANWYKNALKQSLLGQVYADSKKTAGIDIADPQGQKQAFYAEYLETVQKGIFNYIKEEVDSTTGESIPRKYFSGGISMQDNAQTVETASAVAPMVGPSLALRYRLNPTNTNDAAMRFDPALYDTTAEIILESQFVYKVIDIITNDTIGELAIGLNDLDQSTHIALSIGGNVIDGRLPSWTPLNGEQALQFRQLRLLNSVRTAGNVFTDRTTKVSGQETLGVDNGGCST